MLNFSISPSKSCSPLDEVEAVSNNAKLFHKKLKNQSCFSINKFLSKYVNLWDKLVVACSAWPDSMFLVYKLLESDYKNDLVVCYFNHKTRSQTDIEEEFLRNLWKERWFIFESTSFDFKKEIKDIPSVSFEELARNKRYEFFEDVLRRYNSNYIFTAHHLDERIETFVFNLVRWTKLSGLINMTEKSWNILRPLINLEKKRYSRIFGKK